MGRKACRLINSAPGITGSTGGCVEKAYSFLEAGDDELEINMYGEVVESIPTDWWTGEPIDGLYICEKDFLRDLDNYKGKGKITVRINSVGGDCEQDKRFKGGSCDNSGRPLRIGGGCNLPDGEYKEIIQRKPDYDS